jgi:hypothetical protein
MLIPRRCVFYVRLSSLLAIADDPMLKHSINRKANHMNGGHPENGLRSMTGTSAKWHRSAPWCKPKWTKTADLRSRILMFLCFPIRPEHKQVKALLRQLLE